MTGPTAGFAWVANHTAVPAALGTCALDRKKALRCPHFAMTRTGPAGFRFGPGCSTQTIARVADDKRRDPDFGRFAVKCIFQRDFQVVTKIAPAVLAACALAAHKLAEQIVEHVGERRGEVEAVCTPSAHAVFKSGVSKTII